jgi:hypothetical protein
MSSKLHVMIVGGANPGAKFYVPSLQSTSWDRTLQARVDPAVHLTTIPQVLMFYREY